MEIIYIVIPAFEPEAGLYLRIRKMTERIPAQIIVIDDGSGRDYRKIFDQIERTGYCTVLHHDKNKGKGRALKTGFDHIRRQIAEQADTVRYDKSDVRILCADCDGQHLPDDGVRLLEMTRRYPGSLILGVRDFSGVQVPWKSRFGNRFSSVLFRILSGIYLEDTQTGFRAFDGSLLELMLRVPGERFEYETSVLLVCAKQDIPVRTEKIETVYEKKNEGTHFRPVKDSIRVMAALLYEPVRFILSSLFCASLDLFLFWIIERTLRAGQFERILAATAGARLLSSAVNFTINKKWVFGSAEAGNTRGYGREALAYFLLCIGIMAASAISVSAVSSLSGLEPAAVKIPCDILLFFLSFQIQKNRIFRRHGKDGKGNGL